MKIYCKTLEKLTSCGVMNEDIQEPLVSLLLTNNQLSNKYARKLFSYKGYADSRIEVSFYCDILKKIETYETIIAKFYPRK